ncbi:alanine racemase [Marinivivus vitaminiproducens]|uniref:alanine racemase n=1 Tax=Marinivivus vitaminiproducens TaxID=3035935 RepID=UPI0027AB5DE2|nr:alanine racemase [Geminicoccaceae bacterium SCSIO 64248]
MTSTEPVSFSRGRPRLAVDLAAIASNWRRLCAEAPGVEMAGVVKADGYGLGAAKVAAALEAAGCRTFFVATLDEGLALRRAIPDRPIFVLNGLATGAEAEYSNAGLTPVLSTPSDVERCARLARGHATRLRAAIQLDTGMTRLGLGEAELARASDDLALLDPVLVMSHLASADEPDDPANRAQRERFETMTARWGGVRRSLANSPGVFLGPAWRFDLCRPGIALYGGHPNGQGANPMRAVVTLDAPVLQVHEPHDAVAVGYGGTYAAGPGRRIATVGIGYADGLIRAAGNTAYAMIGETRVPFAGRVSMDLLGLDISALPPGAVRTGTPVRIIGGPDGLDDLARAAGTIAYEVLTRLGPRFERVYRNEPAEESRT